MDTGGQRVIGLVTVVQELNGLVIVGNGLNRVVTEAKWTGFSAVSGDKNNSKLNLI